MLTDTASAQRVLVVAAHPDDEVLGCGGTLARHASAGHDVHGLIVAEGLTSRGEIRDTQTHSTALQALHNATERASTILGLHPPKLLGLPDNRLDTLPLLNIVKAIEMVMTQINPSIIYTHHGSDLNVDHRLVHQAVITACRPLPGSQVAAIYGFETVSSTEWSSEALGPPFHPTHFVDISAYLERKMEALQCYEGEMRPFPHARSRENIMALAQHRGASTGLRAAEAFTVIRQIMI